MNSRGPIVPVQAILLTDAVNRATKDVTGNDILWAKIALADVGGREVPAMRLLQSALDWSPAHSIAAVRCARRH